LVSKHTLIQKKWDFRNFSQVKSFLKTGIKEVLHQHHPDDLIQITLLTQGIGRMFFFTNFQTDHFFGIGRVEKYQFSRISDSGRNKGQADIVILRLADIYLMRAEAKLRKSNDGAGALADVNFVRASRTARKAPPALSSMNLDLLFRERGFEFYWEMLRRTDMIRFGKYEGIWTEKTNTDKNKRIFPIPQTAIDGASNLKDYLKQNAGY
jgi:hypothetical protein